MNEEFPEDFPDRDTSRLARQIHFILEIDRLKSVLRRSYLIGADRLENSAEHSWHLAMLAIVLAEHANESIDLLTVLKMVLIHDLVEIDAGDTYPYDPEAVAGQAEREHRAADRLFALLPADQAADLHALWHQFDRRETPEARFAAALDRLMPLLHNYHTAGRAWLEHGVTRAQVLERNRHSGEGSTVLWAFAAELIEEAVGLGYLAGTPE